jgi:dienelactone hydrolase
MDEHLRRRAFLTRSAVGAALLAGARDAASAGDPPQPPSPQSPPPHDPAAADLRPRLLACLGGPWPEPCDLRPKVLQTEPKDGYRLISVTYEAQPNDRIPAYLLIPDGVDAANPAPAVAVWHQHNGAYHLGKVEPAGVAGSPMHHTGAALAKLGYVVLCPDALCFGQRQSKHLRGGDFERFEFLRYVVAGKCMAWKNILDMRRAVDYLCSRPEVRRDKIGCYGHSMGSTHTWLVGPWEPRLACLVGNCCLPTYAAIHRTHILHCFPNFIPGWLQHGDTPDIAGLIAPRALHLNLGELDSGSPVEEVRRGIETIARAYRAAGAADKFSHFIEPGVGHELSAAMWTRASRWFAKHLR